jgi:hypothetical protein
MLYCTASFFDAINNLCKQHAELRNSFGSSAAMQRAGAAGPLRARPSNGLGFSMRIGILRELPWSLRVSVILKWQRGRYSTGHFLGRPQAPLPRGPRDLQMTSSLWPHTLQTGSKYGVFYPVFHRKNSQGPKPPSPPSFAPAYIKSQSPPPTRTPTPPRRHFKVTVP